MHEYFGGLLLLEWYWWVFLIVLILALVVMGITNRFNRLWPLGVLFVTWVLYNGIIWHVWAPLGFLFLVFVLVWWALVIAGLINLVVSDRVVWRRRGWTVLALTAAIGRFLWGVLGAIAIATVLTWVFTNLLHVEADITTGWASPKFSVAEPDVSAPSADVDVDVDSDEDSPPADSDGNSNESDGNQNEDTDPDGACEIWPMYDGTPTKSIWITQLAITNADTNREAFEAFKFGWYDWALNHTAVLSQLADASGVEVPAASELSNNGCATTETEALVNSLLVELQHASYHPVPGAIRVVLLNGNTFRVMADTGQVQPN